MDVSQPTGILLNALAPSNMYAMVVTELTSHLDRCWLNAKALVNIPYMVVTLEVSHVPISLLNA